MYLAKLMLNCKIQKTYFVGTVTSYEGQNASHYRQPGPCLVFSRYGDFHVKDKTVGETVLSLTWESLYM